MWRTSARRGRPRRARRLKCSDAPRGGLRGRRCNLLSRAGGPWPRRCRSRRRSLSPSCPRASRSLLQGRELFEADDVPVEALGGGAAEVAYEVGWLLRRTQHPEDAVVVEHAVELLAD